MRILYIDIDTLRPDHLSCYGYHRNTSPNIDKLAAQGVRFENCYVSDSPCLPSRAALYSGKCGIRNGALNHGGERSEMHVDPATRKFRWPNDNYITRLRQAGYYPVSFSSFGERHSSFWFYQGYREMYNCGKGGSERADEVVPAALDWLDRKGAGDHWYLHVNVWDPHTPYQVPTKEGNPFENEPPPAWMTDTIIQKNWNTYGPGCGQEPGGGFLDNDSYTEHERMPKQIPDLAAYKKWIDGYDTGIWYADKHVGDLVAKLESLGVLDDTLIIISSDHGENQGELAVYGDHQTADHITNRVPVILRHPLRLGGEDRVDRALHYQFDVAATVIDMVGGGVPDSWDGRSFLEAFEDAKDDGRDSVVISNMTWSCQRAARWENYLFIRTYHSGFKNYPDFMLFDLEEDPHELVNLADDSPELVEKGLEIIEAWRREALSQSIFPDPLDTVLAEGGPFHASYKQPHFYEGYIRRLHETGRDHFAEALEARKKAWEEQQG